MVCIACGKDSEAKSIEHIVSESLGNKEYLMAKGKICDGCNNIFAKFEKVALGNSVFAMERARQGIPSKRRRPAKGELDNLRIEGDKDFRKNYIMLYGLEEKNLINFDPRTGKAQLYIPSFDKSEVAGSKLLLKMALESIYTSQIDLYNEYCFDELREFILGRSNIDWPFLTSKGEPYEFHHIPNEEVQQHLATFRGELKFSKIDDHALLFRFMYGAVPMTINVINRDLGWIQNVLKADGHAQLYPDHYRKKANNI